MSLIRIRALEVMGDKIACAVPQLKGKVCAGQAKFPHQQDYPHVALVSTRARYFPEQAIVHSEPTASDAVFYLGRYDATVQIWLGAGNNSQRYELEDLVLTRVFFDDVERPGICLFNVPDCQNARIAWELQTFEWEDERAFDNQWYSILTANVVLPLLVRKSGIYSITDLQVELTSDMVSDFTDIAPSDIETVVVEGI